MQRLPRVPAALVQARTTNFSGKGIFLVTAVVLWIFFCPHGFADHHDCLSFYLPSVFFETGLELAKGDLELLLCDETFWGDTVYSPPVRAPTTDENTHDGQM